MMPNEDADRQNRLPVFVCLEPQSTIAYRGVEEERKKSSKAAEIQKKALRSQL
ncbi:MAG: hypothetical protein K2Z81_01440 [Cyanobacteria bacterium]|nr:hypothetical protein [Cyanobacteriota bacterium]